MENVGTTTDKSDSDAVQRLPQKRHLAYPVVLHFVHEHRHMEPCEPHMRLVIEIEVTMPFAMSP